MVQNIVAGQKDKLSIHPLVEMVVDGIRLN